jgi:hypothetical protein
MPDAEPDRSDAVLQASGRMKREPRQMYAAPAVSWRRGMFFVVTARTPWVQAYMRTDALGDHARWLMSPKRPMSMQREVLGERVITRGPWPIGFKMLDGPRLAFVRVSFIAELGGLVLTAWAIREALRRG